MCANTAQPGDQLARSGRSQILRAIRSQNPGTVPKQPAFGGGSAAGFLPGHGVTAQKLTPPDKLAAKIDDFGLGTAGVGDQGAGLEQRIEMPDSVQNPPDGLGQEDDIGLPGRFGQRSPAVDGSGGDG